MKRIMTIAGPLLVISLGLGGYWLLDATKPPPEKKDDPVRPLSVYIEPVVAAPVVLGVETSGEVRARTSVDLIAQIAGRVVSVSPEFIEGGRIEPDSVLVQIEDTDYKLALKQAEASVADAEVGVQQALADADVARKQLRGAKNPSDLALKKPQVAQAQARLLAAEAGLELARVNLSRTRISLPFDGRITMTNVDVGQYLTPGTPIGRAFATDVVEVRIPLTDAQLASTGLPIGYVAEDEGMPVTLSANVAGQRQQWQAELKRLDASMEPTTRMIYGIAEVRSPYGDNVSQLGMPLAVGLYVQAELAGRTLANATVIPREALRAGDQVFVLNDESRLEVREVRVTHSDRKQAVIASGLQVAERVVVSSIRNPIAGMALKPLGEREQEGVSTARREEDTSESGS